MFVVANKKKTENNEIKLNNIQSKKSKIEKKNLKKYQKIVVDVVV